MNILEKDTKKKMEVFVFNPDIIEDIYNIRDRLFLNKNTDRYRISILRKDNSFVLEIEDIFKNKQILYSNDASIIIYNGNSNILQIYNKSFIFKFLEIYDINSLCGDTIEVMSIKSFILDLLDSNLIISALMTKNVNICNSPDIISTKTSNVLESDFIKFTNVYGTKILFNCNNIVNENTYKEKVQLLLSHIKSSIYLKKYIKGEFNINIISEPLVFSECTIFDKYSCKCAFKLIVKVSTAEENIPFENINIYLYSIDKYYFISKLIFHDRCILNLDERSYTNSYRFIEGIIKNVNRFVNGKKSLYKNI